ncbi:hypothetical protein ACFLS1_09260 [Verrucomicrobiota bacterium]
MFTKTQKIKLKKYFQQPHRLRDLPVYAERIMARTHYKILPNFIHALWQEQVIEPYVFSARNGKNITLYASCNPSALSQYELAAALQPKGYFCNATSIFFHRLTNQVPATVYVCFETIHPKSGAKGKNLSNSSIRQAFLGAHRHTNYVFECKDFSVVVVDRIQGTRFGVENVSARNNLLPSGSYVTGIERALIDAVVSPHYNGGIANVYSYFRHAGPRIKIKQLIDIYKQLKFAYPYSQAIGFFMERLGMQDEADLIHKTFPLKHSFYVDHLAKSSWLHDKKWDIYYPKGLVDEN